MTFDKHVINCESYQKLIKNERQCRVRDKRFPNNQSINQHISRTRHKKELLENQKSLATFTSNEMDTMKKDIEKQKTNNN